MFLAYTSLLVFAIALYIFWDLVLLGVFMKWCKAIDNSCLQKEGKCRKALVQADPFPITNNNPHFIFSSDFQMFAYHFVFLIGKVWLNPAPGVIWH